jgi:glycosyltransferase involved in cell wall biosynthesis
MKPISLSIFFPTYNEEENITATVERTIEVVENSPYISDYEIIVVNDGSKDHTLAIAERLAQKYPTVRVVDHGRNRGYGAALKSGIAASKKEYIFFTDADMQFDILELQNLIVHLAEYPVVIGYRSPRQDPAMRLLNAKVWNMLNRFFFGLKVRDIDCAFKLFKRNLVQNLHLRSQGAMISAETLIRLSRKGVNIKQVPVSHLPRTAGSATGAKPSVIIRAFREMVGLYRGELGSVSHKQVIKFMTVGVLNTALDAVAYIALTRGTDVFAHHLVAAKFFSFMLGTITSLLINRTWTFFEVLRFYATVSVSLAINVEGMNVLVSYGMYDLAALVVTTGFTFFTNFILSKFWVFRTAKTKTDLATQA